MRYVLIDLSSDNYLQQPQVFGGYAGEHNETTLQVKVPNRMIGIEYSGFRFDFQTSEDNKISSPLIPISELNNGVLSFKLTEQLTIAGKLLFNIVGQLSNGDTVDLTSKTNMVTLYIGDSPDGNAILPDPAGYKDDILKMIDSRVAEITGAVIVVDQTYNPESENAQSGMAVKEAIEEAKSYTDNEIAKFDFIKIVNELPDTGLLNRFYLVPKSKQTDNDLFDEYIWVNKGTEENPIYDWEWVTTKQVEVDLTDYATKDEAREIAIDEAVIVEARANEYTDNAINEKIDQVPDPQSENAVSNKAMIQYVDDNILNTEQYVDNLVAQKSQVQIITWEDDD